MKKLILTLAMLALFVSASWAFDFFEFFRPVAPPGAPPAGADALLLETGDKFLLETGDKLLLE